MLTHFLMTIFMFCFIFQELKRSNNTIDTEEFTTENAISNSFDKMLKVQLDPIWHQLSPRTRTLVADVKVLKTVLG